MKEAGTMLAAVIATAMDEEAGSMLAAVIEFMVKEEARSKLPQTSIRLSLRFKSCGSC